MYYYICQGEYEISGMHLSVVRLKSNSKSYGQILMKYSGNAENGTRNKYFDFTSDPDYCLDPEIF